MPLLDPLLPYTLEIDIDETDIDQLGHVSNIVYLRWVQDAATAHWNAVANEEERRALLWVVVRHEIDYKRPAFLRDRIIARTWIGGADRLHFERFTEIVRCSDSKPLATASTLWCPVDAVTKRPVKVSAEIKTRFSNGERILGTKRR